MSQALFNHDRASAKLTAVEKRKEAVQRQIEVQIEAYALIPKGIDSNETITYYRRERERVNARQETDVSNIDSKIKALEAKRQAAIDAIDAKFNADVEALEAKKTALTEKLSTEAERYSLEIERVRAKLEDPEPQTPMFRKLKADLNKLVLEEEEAIKEFREANRVCVADMERQQRNRIEEAKRQEREYYQMIAAKEAEERERIEQRREMERAAEEERAKKRVEESKKLSAGKKVVEYVCRIHPNIPYSIEELIKMNINEFDEEETTLWNNKKREAEYREGIRKWDNELSEI